MFTNAIYRVAAASEKICYLADPGLRGDRRRLWDAAVSATSALSEKLPKVYIQTDIDKHVAYRPLKELLFDGTLAAGAFLEACDLWDAAIDAERRTR